MKLTYYFTDKIARTGISYTGRVLVSNFIEAELNGLGKNNRHVLMNRIRKASEIQKVAVMRIFDEAVAGRRFSIGVVNKVV